MVPLVGSHRCSPVRCNASADLHLAWRTQKEGAAVGVCECIVCSHRYEFCTDRCSGMQGEPLRDDRIAIEPRSHPSLRQRGRYGRTDAAYSGGGSSMIGPGTGVRVYLACGITDMRKGIEGLAALAQDVLRQKPTGGAVFAFRGKRGDRLKLLYLMAKASACITRSCRKVGSHGLRRPTGRRD
jgi:hypothetical protein